MGTSVRLAHFSDIHLTVRHLGWRFGDYFTKRLTGWLNSSAFGRGREFRLADRIVEAMIADIKSRSFDRVLFSGDASCLGFRPEFEHAATLFKVNELNGLAVPGNHDYYVSRAASSGDFERNFAPWQVGERIGRHVYPFAQKVVPVWLAGLNSSVSHVLPWDARGAIGDEQWDRVNELAKRLSAGPRVFVSHYPILKAGGKPERFWHGMPGWRRVQEMAAAAGCVLWLHGHQHRAYNVAVSNELL